MRRGGVPWHSRSADSDLLALIRSGRVAHDGDPAQREHIANTAWKVAVAEDSRGRLVKKGSGKIDSAIALSMSAARCLYLRPDMLDRPAPATAEPAESEWRVVDCETSAGPHHEPTWERK